MTLPSIGNPLAQKMRLNPISTVILSYLIDFMKFLSKFTQMRTADEAILSQQLTPEFSHKLLSDANHRVQRLHALHSTTATHAASAEVD